MVIYPGGSGSRRPYMRGFDAIAAHFWMQGFSCYIGEVSGQDGHQGEFSIQRAVNESLETLRSLQDLLLPSSLYLFGSCSGGTIATCMASEFPLVDGIILFETLPKYDDSGKYEFVSRAQASGVKLSPNFMQEYIDTADIAPRVKCPVLLLHGDASNPPAVTKENVQSLADSFTSASHVEVVSIKGADHNVTRGSMLQPLAKVMSEVDRFVGRYLAGRINSVN